MSKNTERIRDLDLEILDLKKEIEASQGEEQRMLEYKLRDLEHEHRFASETNIEHEKAINNIEKQIGKKEKSLEKTNKELEAFEKLQGEYEQLILYQAGITAERGEGLIALDKEQEEINKSRIELEKMKDESGKVTKEYEEQKKSLDEQQRKIDEAKKKLEDMNRIAQEKLDKDIYLNPNPSIGELDAKLSTPVSKVVKLSTASGAARGVQRGAQLEYAYAKGTDYHPGGMALHGEEGFELARLGNKWSMLGLGISDLPRGTQVFPHDESKKIISALNRLPAYADGISPPGESNRIINQLNQKESVAPVQVHVGQLVVREEADIKRIAKQLHDYNKQSARKVGVVF